MASGPPALEMACSNLHRRSNDGAESSQTKKQVINEAANLFEKTP